MDPAKLASIRKRIDDLTAGGATKENSSELGKLSVILELYARARSLE